MHDVRLVKLLLNHGADITLGNKPVLIAAIAAQDITTVKDLLDLGADCNAKWKSPKIKSRPPHNPLSVMKNTQYYPIHYAASSIFNTEKTRSTAIEIIKLLLTKGADVFLSYDDDDEVLRGTIIHHIFEHGGILQPFLEIPNLGLERRDHLGRTLLLAASCSTAGTFSPTCTNPMTRSFASREKPIQDSVDDPLPCHTLFLLGADLNVVDYQGNSAFHLLVNTSQKNKEQYCKTLTTFVSQAPKLVDKQNKLGATPFHLALQKYHWWTVKTLLNAGANPCLPDPEGNTPLHHIAHVMCTSNGSKELLKWFQTFLSFGISINSKNALGESPVFRYVTGSLLLDKWPSNQIGIHRRLFQPFKEAGADIFATNNEGQTLLHVIPNHVAYPGREDKSNGNEAVDTFEFIMEMGVDPMAEDIFQRTALDVAAACGNRAILALFRRG
jgi:ankyrin repeat protein